MTATYSLSRAHHHPIAAAGSAVTVAGAAGAAKRAVDLVAASVLLVVAAPMIVMLAVAVRATSPGPAFYRQVRVGRRGRTFRIWKLRTMVRHAEADLGRHPTLGDLYRAHHYKIPARLDPRVTALGRFLRRASLDELPQLFNVVAGQMSLVGPRPVVPDELALYGDVAALYQKARPGITGYWQVHGRSHVTGADRIALDRHYLQHANVWLDTKILAQPSPPSYAAAAPTRRLGRRCSSLFGVFAVLDGSRVIDSPPRGRLRLSYLPVDGAEITLNEPDVQELHALWSAKVFPFTEDM